MDLMQADDLRNTFDIQDGSLPFFRVYVMSAIRALHLEI
jgi:hypothetical protein